MNAETRQIAIYDMIKSNKEMSVNTLAQCFGVSAMNPERLGAAGTLKAHRTRLWERSDCRRK